ncbi:MAG: aminotransferase class V-fold PLP-dependent enzyme [Pseudomonadota bacterium]
MTLDTDFARAQFPAFSEQSLADWAHFENAGGSYACGQVISRLTRFYTERKLQPYGRAAPSAAGGEEMDEARTRLAGLLNVAPKELSFGPSTTQNAYVLAQAFRQHLKPGDAIIVTDQDHEANTGPWRRLEETGTEIRIWPIDPETGALDRAVLADLLDERVRLVAFPHCSNIIGTANPVSDIVADVHAAGALACVDGVSYAPHGLPDVAAMDADIYLFSTYKTYGPHLGVMILRNGVAAHLPNQGHWFNGADPTKRFTPAGPDHAQIAAAAGIADYIDALDAHHFGDDAAPAVRGARVARLMGEAERDRLAPLLGYLRERNDIRLIGGTGPDKVPTVAMHHTRPGAELAHELAEHGIMAGGGDFYANRLLDALGIDPAHGVLRVSFVHYTSDAEVTHLIEALDRVL